MDLTDMQEHTGLMAVLQELIPPSMAVERGVVTSASPVAVQLLNDEKMVVSGNLLIVPRHLTDYKTTADITADGSLDANTTENEGKHGHAGTETTGNDGEHTHTLKDFQVLDATVTIKNALEKGDTVVLLSFNYGKRYYILDREAF